MSDVIQKLITRFAEAEATLRGLATDPELSDDEVERLTGKANDIYDTGLRLKKDALTMHVTNNVMENKLAAISILMNLRKDVTEDSYNSVGAQLEGQNVALEFIRQSLYAIIE